jgi:hypothetical protein
MEKTPKSLTEIPIRIRKATEADVSFIFNSWLKSYRDSFFARGVASNMYFSEHHKVIERILKTCEVYIACDDADAMNIYGWACAEFIDNTFVIHYSYVKQMYRFLGIANLLISQYKHNPEVASLYTHHTKYAEKICPRKSIFYSPYIALTPDYRKDVELEKRTKPTE